MFVLTSVVHFETKKALGLAAPAAERPIRWLKKKYTHNRYCCSRRWVSVKLACLRVFNVQVRAQKDTRIVPGQPLPNVGACSHCTTPTPPPACFPLLALLPTSQEAAEFGLPDFPGAVESGGPMARCLTCACLVDIVIQSESRSSGSGSGAVAKPFHARCATSSMTVMVPSPAHLPRE